MANEECDALDALEREAKEYDKVSLTIYAYDVDADQEFRMLKLIAFSKLSD
jgi:hypothetical protein